MDDTWVKSYRRTMEKGWYKKSEYFHLWHHLIYKATHAGNEFYFNGENMKLNPGEFITGRKKLSEETGINESKVERILKFFEKNEQQIEQQKTNKNRLIRVLNYEKYQFKIPSEQQNKQQLNNKRTTTEQQLNTINNDNKENNVNNIPFNSKEFLKVWAEWEKHRSEIKKKLTSTTKQKQFKKLSNYSEAEAIEMLEQSIENGWQGIFEIKKKKTQQWTPVGN